MEVLTGFETFDRSAARRRSSLSFRVYRVASAPSYWHAEAMWYVSVWRNMEEDSGTCDVI